MSNLKIDINANEIMETPIMPDGTVVTLQISGEPEIKESNNHSGEHYLNFPVEVIAAEKKEYVGLSLFHMVSMPEKKMETRMLDENKQKGWLFIKNNWAVFTKVCKVNKVEFDTQRLIGKKFKVSIKAEEYEGRTSNKINTILEAV